MAMRIRLQELMAEDRVGQLWQRNRAIQSAPIAWCIAAMKLRPSIMRLGRCRGMFEMVVGFLKRHDDRDALALLNEPEEPVHSYNPLVQIKEAESTQA